MMDSQQPEVKMRENVPDVQREHQSPFDSAQTSRVRGWLSGWKIFILLPLVLAFAAVAWSRVTTAKGPYPDLLNADLEELVTGLEKGLFSSVDLTNAYIKRIQEVNPVLHAVTQINPDALSIAAALDEERANGITRGCLHGIPMLIKDNIATNDSMDTSAGSYLLLGAKAPRDAFVIAKLRAAGVIILGKSNLSEWANSRSNNSSNGWSAVGGQTTGAYYPKMDPSGSSSGSAVVSSIGLAFASLGTETYGSILSPSRQNNLVGIKPTVGLTSRSLVIPISEHQDTVGPMARTVSDAASILSIIAGKDELDNYTSAQPWQTSPDYTKSLNFSSLSGARIGIPRNAIPADTTSQSVLDAFEEAIVVLRSAGAIIIDYANYSATDEEVLRGEIIENKVLGADLVSSLAKYFSQLTSNPHNLSSLVGVRDLTQSFEVEEFPARDTAWWDDDISLGFDNTDYRFWEAYEFTSNLGGKLGVTGSLETYDLDALILPTDHSTFQTAMAGLPVVTVPMGSYPRDTKIVKSTNWGLVQVGPKFPLGLSFIGPKWSEEMLIGFAFAYEQRTQFRKTINPYIFPRTQLGDVIRA